LQLKYTPLLRIREEKVSGRKSGNDLRSANPNQSQNAVVKIGVTPGDADGFCTTFAPRDFEANLLNLLVAVQGFEPCKLICQVLAVQIRPWGPFSILALSSSKSFFAPELPFKI
jgi:hypothetical protein